LYSQKQVENARIAASETALRPPRDPAVSTGNNERYGRGRRIGRKDESVLVYLKEESKLPWKEESKLPWKEITAKWAEEIGRRKTEAALQM